MIDEITNNIEFDYHICATIEEAVELGERNSSYDYHVLISQKTGIVCLVYHLNGSHCMFCNMETDEVAIFI